MKRSKPNSKKGAKTKLAEMRDAWPLNMMIQLSHKILDKGVVKGDEVIFSDEDRKKLLFYSSKIDPILSKIKQTQGAKVGPLEKAIDDLRKKMRPFNGNAGKGGG